MEERAGLGNYLPGYRIPAGRASRGDLPDATRFLQLGSDSSSSKSDRYSRRSHSSDSSIEVNGRQRFSTGYHIGIGAAYFGLFLILILYILWR